MRDFNAEHKYQLHFYKFCLFYKIFNQFNLFLSLAMFLKVKRAESSTSSSLCSVFFCGRGDRVWREVLEAFSTWPLRCQPCWDVSERHVTGFGWVVRQHCDYVYGFFCFRTKKTPKTINLQQTYNKMVKIYSNGSIKCSKNALNKIPPLTIKIKKHTNPNRTSPMNGK